MRTSLAFLALFLLACSGALNSMTPAVPVSVPAGANTTGINIATHNGVSTTDVSFSTAKTPTELQTGFETELIDAGWELQSTAGSGDSVITATKGDEALSITIRTGADGAEFDVHWVH